jgi:hypothetical protein
MIMLTVCLIGAGLIVIGINAGLPRWAPPPAPSAADARPPAAILDGGAAAGYGDGHGHGRGGPAPLPRSVPVSLTIPAIGVNAQVIPLGLDASGGVAIPPLSTPFLARWYDKGPAPGRPRPSA